MGACGMKSEAERYAAIASMSHDERLKYADTHKKTGYVFFFLGFAICASLISSTWETLGPGGAIGIGVAFGMGIAIASGASNMKLSKEALKWDEKIEQGKTGGKADPSSVEDTMINSAVEP